ncbi:MAG: hypothetical protein ACRYFS_15455, partial [Janthinobacterium lividum]
APQNIEEADEVLNGALFELVDREEFDLAVMLGEYAVSLPKFSSDEMRRMLLINASQAFKWTGRTDEAIKLLDKEDWSSCSDKFTIAVKVIKNDFDAAIVTMKRIGSTGSVKMRDYARWPLFKEIRNNAAFLSTYESIFGEPLSVSVKQSMEDESDDLEPQSSRPLVSLPAADATLARAD